MSIEEQYTKSSTDTPCSEQRYCLPATSPSQVVSESEGSSVSRPTSIPEPSSSLPIKPPLNINSKIPENKGDPIVLAGSTVMRTTKSSEDLGSKAQCRLYQQGDCNRGSACKYKHADSAHDSASVSEAHKKNQVDAKKKQQQQTNKKKTLLQVMKTGQEAYKDGRAYVKSEPTIMKERISEIKTSVVEEKSIPPGAEKKSLIAEVDKAKMASLSWYHIYVPNTDDNNNIEVDAAGRIVMKSIYVQLDEMCVEATLRRLLPIVFPLPVLDGKLQPYNPDQWYEIHKAVTVALEKYFTDIDVATLPIPLTTYALHHSTYVFAYIRSSKFLERRALPLTTETTYDRLNVFKRVAVRAREIFGDHEWYEFCRRMRNLAWLCFFIFIIFLVLQKDCSNRTKLDEFRDTSMYIPHDSWFTLVTVDSKRHCRLYVETLWHHVSSKMGWLIGYPDLGKSVTIEEFNFFAPLSGIARAVHYTFAAGTDFWYNLVGVEPNPGPTKSYNHWTVKAPVIPGPFKEGALLMPIESKKRIKFRELVKPKLFRSKYDPIVYGQDATSQLSALTARVLKATPVPDPDTMNDFVGWAKSNFHVFAKTSKITSKPFDKYIQDSNASPSVKQKLRRCKEVLDKYGIDENTRLKTRTCNKWTIREGFVKVENNIYRTPLGNNEKAARLIQAAKPEFICLVGPWIAALQEDFQRQFSKDTPFFWTCGADATEVAEYLRDFHGEVVEDDVSAWDASMCRALGELEVWVAQRFGAPKAVVRLMRANIFKRGYTNDFYYEVDGIRASGDPYTAIFNMMINVLVHSYIYCKHTGKQAYELKKHVKMVVQGDDLTLRGTTMHQIPFKKHMLKLGFKADAIKRSSLEETEFCSCFYISDGVNCGFVPKPGRFIAKLGFSINLPLNISDGAYVRGLALSMSFMFPKDPLIQALSAALMRLYPGSKLYLPPTLAHKMRGQVTVSLDSMWKSKYHMNNYDILRTIRWLEQAQIGDEWPQLFQLCVLDRDTSGPPLLH